MLLVLIIEQDCQWDVRKMKIIDECNDGKRLKVFWVNKHDS